MCLYQGREASYHVLVFRFSILPLFMIYIYDFGIVPTVWYCLFSILFYKCKYTQCNIIQLLPALKVNIIIVHPRGVVFPRENNIPKVNNYDVHRKCRQ
jgi:uncharacterized membrane protein YagU involved in acid resistance